MMTEIPIKDREILIKRLLYRSNNRGSKETDLLLGTFAAKNLHALTDEELVDYEELLNESDIDIFLWMTGKEPAPTHYNSGLIEKLLAFKFAG